MLVACGGNSALKYERAIKYVARTFGSTIKVTVLQGYYSSPPPPFDDFYMEGMEVFKEDALDEIEKKPPVSEQNLSAILLFELSGDKAMIFSLGCVTELLDLETRRPGMFSNSILLLLNSELPRPLTKAFSHVLLYPPPPDNTYYTGEAFEEQFPRFLLSLCDNWNLMVLKDANKLPSKALNKY